MTIDEILAELRIETPPAESWQRFRDELLANHRTAPPGAIACARRIVASALVRAGVWLDRHAGERFLKPNTN